MPDEFTSTDDQPARKARDYFTATLSRFLTSEQRDYVAKCRRAGPGRPS